MFGNWFMMGAGNTRPPYQSRYRCRSMAFFNPDNERGGKICLPSSALEWLVGLNVQYPMLFELTTSKGPEITHVGVLDFTAEEGECYVPVWIMNNLNIRDGDFVNVRNVSLLPGSYVKLQPHKKEFVELTNPQVVLERELRNHSALTVGNVLCIYYNNTKYFLNVVAVSPPDYNAISIVERDISLEFAPPLDLPRETTPSRPAARVGVTGRRAKKVLLNGVLSEIPIDIDEEFEDVSATTSKVSVKSSSSISNTSSSSSSSSTSSSSFAGSGVGIPLGTSKAGAAAAARFAAQSTPSTVSTPSSVPSGSSPSSASSSQTQPNGFQAFTGVGRRLKG